MKKTFMAAFILVLMLLIPSCVYAGSPGSLEEVDFTITGGIAIGEVQSTFDNLRTISGSAQSGTSIQISISTKNALGDLEPICDYTTEVGATGIFVQSVDLELGENIIVMTASKEGREPVIKEAVIKRKRQEIKKELENGISIPGLRANIN